MADPERLVRELPEESPPPEIVLAAVRTFRYRAIAAIAVAVAVAVVGIVTVPRLISALLDPRDVDELAFRAMREGITYDVAADAEVDGGRVLLWQVWIGEEGLSYARFLAWRPGGIPIDVLPQEIRIGGREARITGGGGGAGCCDPATAESLIEFEAGFPFAGPVEADVVVTLGEGDDARSHLIQLTEGGS